MLQLCCVFFFNFQFEKPTRIKYETTGLTFGVALCALVGTMVDTVSTPVMEWYTNITSSQSDCSEIVPSHYQYLYLDDSFILSYFYNSIRKVIQQTNKIQKWLYFICCWRSVLDVSICRDIRFTYKYIYI